MRTSGGLGELCINLRVQENLNRISCSTPEIYYHTTKISYLTGSSLHILLHT